VEFANEESATAVLTQESLPSLNGKRLTVKERTLNKVALQVKLPKTRKRKRNDSQQDAEGQQEEMASFLSEDLITKLKSTPTVGGSLILVHTVYHLGDHQYMYESIAYYFPYKAGTCNFCQLKLLPNSQRRKSDGRNN